jgi:hypothetical protein
MRQFSVLLSVCVVVLLGLWGCSKEPNFVAKEEPWRDDDERACLASGLVRENPFLQTRAALGGPSVCGALRPFAMSGAAFGRVSMKPAAMLRCPMVPQIERWVQEVVEPAAKFHLGVALAEMKVAASYACRPINGQSGGKLSEHGRANALDVSAFHLADGSTVTVKDGWQGGQRERSFLRAIHAGACQNFTTVLGPNADRHHHDHFHLDLARHGRDGMMRVCQ